MANRRRGGGPPDFRGALGSLIRSTLDQVEVVKDVVEKQTRKGGFVDQALSERRRREAFADLGRMVYQLAQHGSLHEVASDPGIAMAISEIDEIGEDEASERGEAVSSQSYSSAGIRGNAGSSKESGEYRVWRPNVDEIEDTVDEPAPSSEPQRRAERTKKGIRFVDEPDPAEDDSDLHEYMHDDDVP